MVVQKSFQPTPHTAITHTPGYHQPSTVVCPSQVLQMGAHARGDRRPRTADYFCLTLDNFPHVRELQTDPFKAPCLGGSSERQTDPPVERARPGS